MKAVGIIEFLEYSKVIRAKTISYERTQKLIKQRPPPVGNKKTSGKTFHSSHC